MYAFDLFPSIHLINSIIHEHSCENIYFLYTISIRKFEILPWDRNSYLTHIILPRLSLEDHSLVVLELSHMVIK